MKGVEYGYVGKGKRIHIVRAESTTYCERTVSQRISDPGQVDPGEVCKTCWTRCEEALGEVRPEAPDSGGETVAPGAEAEPVAASSAAGEAAAEPLGSADERLATATEPDALLEKWDALMGRCEEKLGGLCAPLVLVGLFGAIVIAVEILLLVGIIQVLVLLALVAGGGYAYLRLTGQEDRWDRILTSGRRFFSGVWQRLSRMFS